MFVLVCPSLNHRLVDRPGDQDPTVEDVMTNIVHQTDEDGLRSLCFFLVLNRANALRVLSRVQLGRDELRCAVNDGMMNSYVVGFVPPLRLPHLLLLERSADQDPYL